MRNDDAIHMTVEHEKMQLDIGMWHVQTAEVGDMLLDN